MQNKKIITRALTYITPIEYLLSGYTLKCNLKNKDVVLISGDGDKLYIERTGYNIYFIPANTESILNYFSGENIESIQ